ncbi:MAG TPA: hypothetical protein PKE04_07315 [Clostridia bacterium]|nr:hypothetical protein [Clostridia bacterium]
MAYLTERLQRLRRIKASIRTALALKGQAVADGDAMEVYADKILAIAAAPVFPGFAYSGRCLTRAVPYGENWYYEWEFISSGSLTLDSAVTADFTMIGGGGNTVTNAMTSGHSNAGGGSGYLQITSAIRLPEQTPVVIMVGPPSEPSSVTLPGIGKIEALPGGDDGGAGYTGYYDLYGDPNRRKGQGANGAPFGPVNGVNGKGGGGCEITALAADATTELPARLGYGAGGNGFGSFSEKADGRGTQGVVLMRVKMETADASSMPALFDIHAASGDLGVYTVPKYAGPTFRLSADGDLVMIESESEEGKDAE